MITVMGATGQTGSKIARALLAAGEKVRALGRSREKLAALAADGAEARAGDTADAGFLTEAFRGAEAVYTLLPTDRRAPDYAARQREEGLAIVEAIRAAGVRRVVALSSLGAEVPAGTGVIAGLHEQEERLRALEGVDLLLVRPVSFFENYFDQLELVRSQGIVADSVAPDLAIPMVATRDVADVAARALATGDWHGVAVRELLGPRDLAPVEAARILGERIGKPELPYVALGYEEMAGALVEAGLSESFARLYVEMTRAFNEGRVGPLAGRTPENTTPTRFEDFADEWAAAFKAA